MHPPITRPPMSAGAQSARAVASAPAKSTASTRKVHGTTGGAHDRSAGRVQRGERVVGPGESHPEECDGRHRDDAAPCGYCRHQGDGATVEAIRERAADEAREDHRAQRPQRHVRDRECRFGEIVDVQPDCDDGQLRPDLGHRGAGPQPGERGTVPQRRRVDEQPAKPATSRARGFIVAHQRTLPLSAGAIPW